VVDCIQCDALKQSTRLKILLWVRRINLSLIQLREISWQLKISLGSVNRIVKQDVRLKCCKKCRATELTAANKIARLLRLKQLLEHYPASLVNFIFFTNEKLFTIARPSNSQNDRVYHGINKVKEDVDCRRLLRTCQTFSRSVMVSVGISALGRTSIQFVEPGVKVNGAHYRNVLLTQCLLPEMRELSDFFTFQQDSAQGLVLLLSCWKRKFPISFLHLCGRLTAWI